MPIDPRDIVGLRASFEHDGRKLTGIITAAVDNGFAEPGHIPDLLVTVRGASGASITVSLVESDLTLPDR